MAVFLEEITDQNREAVVALRVAPGQERFVSSVEDSLAAAADWPEARPWYRAVFATDEPAGPVGCSREMNSRSAEQPWSARCISDTSSAVVPKALVSCILVGFVCILYPLSQHRIFLMASRVAFQPFANIMSRCSEVKTAVARWN